VSEQLQAHVSHGYKPVLFVLTNFKDTALVPDGVEVRPIVPQLYLEAYKGLGYPENIQEEVNKVSAAFREHMADIEVLITHDVIFIDTYLPYNIGLRESGVTAKQLHFIHSAPSPRPIVENNPHANRYTLPANSKLVYLNSEQTIPLAEMYGVWPNDVRVVKNSVDPRSLWNLHPFTERLIKEYDVFSRDIVTVYPVSATRMVDGKQIDVVIRIHEALKKIGHNPLLIFPTAHANAQAEISQCKARATQDVVFTSLFEPKYDAGLPRRIVSELFRLSNVFVFPSISENCSLVLLEAMLAGNLLVLNSDCPGLKDIVGADKALWFKFGNVSMGTRNYESALQKDQYYMDIARIISASVTQNLMYRTKLHAFREYNRDSMFRNLERLYYEKD
jgi:glycosyltransferase involved in cell wall biosynthesis